MSTAGSISHEHLTISDRHPKALYLLFFTEMWERFSYYGMRALLTLYMVTEIADGGLGWASQQAGQLYGIYTGLVYVTPLIGGFIADRLIGFRYAVLIGGSIMALGHASLAVDSMIFFYLGLFCLIIGNGLFKPNISSMVGQLYPEGSPLKDSAYTIFYMGINIGAFIGVLICGYLAEKIGWHWGFGAAGIGMVFGLVLFYLGQGMLGKIGLKPEKKQNENQEPKEPLTKVEIDRLVVVFVMSFFSIIFWMCFEQGGASMNIYALKFTDRIIGGWEMPASWFQSVNSMFIFMFAPLFSWLWVKLESYNLNPNGLMKFAIGLLLLGFGFISLVVGSSQIPSGAETAKVSMLWLVLAYLFQTYGELCLSPVGLSFVNKLSPKRLLGMMFGIWFLASAIGNYIAGAITGFIDEISRNASLSYFFGIFVVAAATAALVLYVLSFFLRKLMHGVK
ncbi:MAG: peptide MFS transporter [Chloroherpetonaceae bacterium]|nr:peptide MFS transporter [Chloroherpetonaceae bacterium]